MALLQTVQSQQRFRRHLRALAAPCDQAAQAQDLLLRTDRRRLRQHLLRQMVSVGLRAHREGVSLLFLNICKINRRANLFNLNFIDIRGGIWYN